MTSKSHYSAHQSAYFAHQLTRRFPSDSAAKLALTLEEKLARQKQVKLTEARRNSMRRAIFEAQDQVDKQREELIAAIEGKMNQNARLKELFSIR